MAQEILYITALTIVAGGVGTLTGFGTSTIMVPALLLFYPLPQTLLLVAIVHWFGDIWKLLLFREGIRWRLIVAFGVPGLVMSFAGARATLIADETVLSRVLGGVLLLYVVFLLFKSTFKMAENLGNAGIGGGLSGFLAGLFGVGGAVRGAFLLAFDLPKAVYIATSGGIGLVIDSTRLITYWAGGTRLPEALALGLIAFIPASLLGAKLAERVVDRIPQQSFRIVVAVFLMLAGVRLLVFPS